MFSCLFLLGGLVTSCENIPDSELVHICVLQRVRHSILCDVGHSGW